jgi:hypothetical protein
MASAGELHAKSAVFAVAGRRLPRFDEERLRLLAALDQAYPPATGTAGPA